MNLGNPSVEFPCKRHRGARALSSSAITPCLKTPTAPSWKWRLLRPEADLFGKPAQEPPDYDGHHIAVYVANFSGPHGYLDERGLITEESDNCQYRFQDIVNPDTGKVLFTLEHEVRSMRHPMWGREFINRNAAQNIRSYARGRDAFSTISASF